MALNVETGIKLSPGATGVQNYSLPAGFGTPKALIVWTTNQAADGTGTADGIAAYGIATNRGGNIQTAYYSYRVDPANTVSRIITAAQKFDASGSQELLRVFNTDESTTADWIILFAGFADEQWSIDWTNLPATASTRLHYIVLGGSDISDAMVGDFTLPTSGSPLSETIVSGFGQPDLLNFISIQAAATAGSLTNDMAILNAWAVSDTERCAWAYMDDDGAATIAVGEWMKARAGMGMTSAAAVNSEWDLDAKANWPTDGFQITIPDFPAGAHPVYYLALKGTFQKKIINSSTPTSTGNQDLDAGFVPKLGLVVAHNAPVQDTIYGTNAGPNSGFSLGATDGTNQSACGFSQDDGKGTSFGRKYSDDATTMQLYHGETNAAMCIATGSFSGNNLRLNYTTVFASATEFYAVALGDAPPATESLAAVANGAATVTAALSERVQLASSSLGVATVTADLTGTEVPGTEPLAAVVAGVGTVTAALAERVQLAGVSTCAAVVTAALGVRDPLAAVVAGVGTVTADLSGTGGGGAVNTAALGDNVIWHFIWGQGR